MEAAEYRRMFDHETRHWWFVGTRAVVLDVLMRHLGPPARGWRFLDVGCGTGHTTARLSEHGVAVGVDSSAEGLALAVERPGGMFVRGDAGRLPIASSSVDAVTLLDVIEHADDERPILAEAARVLRPGGVLLVTVPAFQALWSEHDVALHHRRRYRAARVGALLSAQPFDVERLTYYNFFLFPIVAVVRLLRRLRPRREQAPTSDLSLPPGPVNRALAALLSFERHLLRWVRLPWGVSVLAVARRRE